MRPGRHERTATGAAMAPRQVRERFGTTEVVGAQGFQRIKTAGHAHDSTTVDKAAQGGPRNTANQQPPVRSGLHDWPPPSPILASSITSTPGVPDLRAMSSRTASSVNVPAQRGTCISSTTRTPNGPMTLPGPRNGFTNLVAERGLTRVASPRASSVTNSTKSCTDSPPPIVSTPALVADVEYPNLADREKFLPGGPTPRVT